MRCGLEAAEVAFCRAHHLDRQHLNRSYGRDNAREKRAGGHDGRYLPGRLRCLCLTWGGRREDDGAVSVFETLVLGPMTFGKTRNTCCTLGSWFDAVGSWSCVSDL